MPTSAERHRNNVRAGIFVLASTILALLVVAFMRNSLGGFFRERAQYVMTFPVSSGVQTLTEGSAVRIGGLEMGEVKSVRLLGLVDELEPDVASEMGGPFDTIVVRFELKSAVTIYHNAVAYVKSGLLGSEAWIEFIDVGGEHSKPRLAAPDASGQSVENAAHALAPNAIRDHTNWLRGTTGAGMLANFVGPENAVRASNIMTNIETLTQTFPKFSDDYESYIRPLLANAEDSAARVNEIAVLLGSDWHQWAYLIEQTLLNALAMSDKLELAVDDGRALLTDARSGVADVRDTIESNRPDLDAIADNLRVASSDVQAITNHVSGSLLAKAEALLDRGQDAADSVARTAGRLELEFDSLTPSIRDTMANLQISSAELKLAMTEIRSSPWRLLYRPPAKELEYENLYFATTKFALATTELKMASQAVDRAITNHREYLAQNPGRLEELQDLLAASMASYEQAQRRLVELLNAR